MKRSSAIVAVYDDNHLADVALERFVDQLGGRTAITLAGIDRPNCALPITLYKANNRARVWGRPAQIWEKQWPLFADGISIPSGNAGAMYVLGYLASAVIAGVDGHDHVTGEGAFASALLNLGMQSKNVARLQADVEAGRLIVMANVADSELCHLSQPIGAIDIHSYDTLSDAPAMPPLREDFHVEMHCHG